MLVAAKRPSDLRAASCRVIPLAVRAWRSTAPTSFAKESMAASPVEGPPYRRGRWLGQYVMTVSFVRPWEDVFTRTRSAVYCGGTSGRGVRGEGERRGGTRGDP